MVLFFPQVPEYPHVHFHKVPVPQHQLSGWRQPMSMEERSVIEPASLPFSLTCQSNLPFESLRPARSPPPHTQHLDGARANITIPLHRPRQGQRLLFHSEIYRLLTTYLRRYRVDIHLQYEHRRHNSHELCPRHQVDSSNTSTVITSI